MQVGEEVEASKKSDGHRTAAVSGCAASGCDLFSDAVPFCRLLSCGSCRSSLISWASLNLVPGAYFRRGYASLVISDIVIGLFKAMFFGLLIGLIACYQVSL